MNASFTRRSIALLVLLIVQPAALPVAVALSPPPAEIAPSNAPADFVRNFFTAFDQRDLKYLSGAFEPSGTVVHDDGVINTVPELLKVISDAKEWAPRHRELGQFKVEKLGSTVLLVTCRNRVVFNPDTQPSEYVYTETWLLRSRNGKLRAIRSHYSRITQSVHSEESNQ